MTRVLWTTRRTTTVRLLGTALVGALAITACSGDDGDESDDEATPDAQTEQADDGSSPEPETTTGAPDEAADTGDAGGGNLPDPCSLVPQAELTSLLGTDPGPGTGYATTGDTVTCQYEGLILEIGPESHYDTMLGNVEGADTLPDVSGVGQEAKWWHQGSLGVLYARDDEYFVSVTLPSDQDAATAIGQAMLAAA